MFFAEIYNLRVGDVICTSDGRNVTFTTNKNADIQTNPTQKDTTDSGDLESGAGEYVGNKNSKVYHLPTCSSLPTEDNREYFTSKEGAEENGYTPCGRCKP